MHELNGLKVKVAESPDSSKKGLEGRIVWETKRMLEIEARKGRKKVEKKGNVFEFKIAGKLARLSGSLIEARPEDRVKLLAKKMRMV